MSLRVLLVESSAEDVLFLRDVLIEIEAGRFWNTWVQIETLHAGSWSEASAILASEPVDLILLDPDLVDTKGADSFRRVHAAAERVPMILLIGAEDTALAVRLIREGAQDFLIKRQIDCAPMAHAMRNAIERHRLLTSVRAGAINDALTGLPNRSTFITFADRDRKLAERLGRRMMVLIAEPKNLAGIALAFGEQRRDLALVDAADHLRGVAGPTDLLARIGECRFGLATIENGFETLESVWARVHSSAVSHRIVAGAAIFDPDRPVSLETLLDQAAMDMNPNALAMRT